MKFYMFGLGDPYKPSFVTTTGKGDNPRYTTITTWWCHSQISMFISEILGEDELLF